MKVAVKDANVLIDLVEGDLLGAADAAVRLERVVDAGAHLPAEQVQARLRKWRTA
jgi:hypothetical protein